MIEQIIAEYLAFLLSQLKIDLGWITTWWMWVLFLVPISCYLLFALLKWFLLLAPITFPIALWGFWRPSPVHNHYHGKDAEASHTKWMPKN